MHQQLLQRLQLPFFCISSVFVSGYLQLGSFPTDMCGFVLSLLSRNEYAAYSIIVCRSLLSFPFQRP